MTVGRGQTREANDSKLTCIVLSYACISASSLEVEARYLRMDTIIGSETIVIQ